MFKWGSRSLGYLDDIRLEPTIKVFMTEALKESTVDITIIDGARTKVTQNAEYRKGTTWLDGINDLSDHQIEKYEDMLGRAVDVIPAVPKGRNLWDTSDDVVNVAWTELFRAVLRVDRLWKLKGVDVGLELGWTYNMKSGRDYPHIGFKLIGL